MPKNEIGTKVRQVREREGCFNSPIPTEYQGSVPEGKLGLVPRGTQILLKDKEPEADKESEQQVRQGTGSVLRVREPAGCEQLSLSKADVVERAMELADEGASTSAASLLITTFDELFRARQFPLCDSILNRISVGECSTELLVWIVKATWPARSKLTLRSRFVENARSAISNRGDLSPAAIARLE